MGKPYIRRTPEDLGLKMGTKDQVVYEEWRKALEAEISADERRLLVNRKSLELCNQLIADEEKKMQT